MSNAAALRSLCVFCGSSEGAHPAYVRTARAVGALLADRGIELIYGGGRVGLMGALADAVLAGGGRVIGVIPQMLLDREVGHSGLSELRVVRSLAERKAVMGELSDAFIALPGGIGTLDEITEVWTWTQLRLQRKPCGLLNIESYFDPLIAFFDRARDEGFLRSNSRDVLLVDDDIGRLLWKTAEWLNAPPY